MGCGQSEGGGRGGGCGQSEGGVGAGEEAVGKVGRDQDVKLNRVCLHCPRRQVDFRANFSHLLPDVYCLAVSLTDCLTCCATDHYLTDFLVDAWQPA